MYYSINKNNILKIDYLSVNNDFYDTKQLSYDNDLKIILAKEETTLLNKYLIKYIENISKSKNITKIIIDVHNNMERFNLELKDLGFILTDNRCEDNPYWFKAEKNL